MYSGGKLPLLAGGPPGAGAGASARGGLRSLVLATGASSIVRGGLVLGALVLLLLSYALVFSDPEALAQSKKSSDSATARAGGAAEALLGPDKGEASGNAGSTPAVVKAEASEGPGQANAGKAEAQDTGDVSAVQAASSGAPAGAAAVASEGASQEASPDQEPVPAEASAAGASAGGASPGEADSGPDPARPSKCSDQCFERGTCNEETGECMCTTNWGGPDCADLAMPSCQLTAEFGTYSCKDLTTCECAQECQKLRLPTHGFLCFRGTDANGTKLTELAQIFSGPRYPLLWNQERVDFIPQDYARPPAETGTSPVTDPRECPKMCGGKFVCGRENKNCFCSWAAAGESCEQTPAGLRVPCFNGCSGHGQCVWGVCKCDRGYFGLDCSLFRDRHGRTRILQIPPYNWSKTTEWPKYDKPPRPRIFVYDLPPYFNTWQGLHSGFLDWAEPIWFTERVHNTPHRTADPEEADFFYIPLFVRNRGGNKHSIIRFAKDYVRQKWPFFNRTGGKDHFIFLNSDWASCELGDVWGERSSAVEDIFTLNLWGCSVNMHMEHKDVCFRPGFDVVAPPDQDQNVYRFSPYMTTKPPEPPFDKRTILLYFRGFPAEGLKPFGRGWYIWSFGVRPKMFEHFRGTFNDTGILLETMETGPWDYWHLRQMLRSVFCLGPSGWGWGMRAPQAVIMGCIPVVIQPFTFQPLEGDGLDWNDFGVVLNLTDIPQLDKILSAIPEDVIEQKREAMKRVYSKLVWSATNYNPLTYLDQEERDKRAPDLLKADAFAGLMEALRLRLEKMGKL